MKKDKFKGLLEIYLFIGAMVLGISLQACFFFHFKNEVVSNNTSIEFHFSSNPSFTPVLYYTYGNDFESENRIVGRLLADNTVGFDLPKENSLYTNFRLDFDDAPKDSYVLIDSLSLSYGSKRITFNKERVFEHIFLNSEAVNLNFKDKTIGFNQNVSPFDPYIIFDPVLHIILDNHPLKLISILFPFTVLLLILLRYSFKRLKLTILNLLILAFIVCIPLKIAWTTFTAVLICIWGLYMSLKQHRFNFKNPNGLVLLAIFFALVIFGRPTELKVIDHQMALPIFYLIISSGILRKEPMNRFYVYLFLFLNGIMVTSALGFLISFESVFGLDIMEYFNDIKTYSGNIRDWLYYDHAAFLTFFAIIILPIMDEMAQFDRKTRIFKLYNVLVVLTIVLMGARISFLIYLVILLNLFLKGNYKWRIGFNTFLFVIITTFLFVKIEKIDQNRYELWRGSFEAIKESPFLGYGLGSSDNILHQSELSERTGIIIPPILNHSHNQFLTLWLELGLVGILSIYTILCIYLKRTRHYKSKPMVLFIFGLSYIFLTESILLTSKPFFVLCFLFALITTNINYKGRYQQQSNVI